MAKTKTYNSVQIRALRNGWEVAAFMGYRPSEEQCMHNTFVFESFDSMTKWLKANVPQLGDQP